MKASLHSIPLLLALISPTLLAEMPPPVRPVPQEELFENTDTARIRITVVDRAFLDSLPPDAPQSIRDQLQAAILATELRTAISRADFFKKSLENRTIAAWTAETSVSPNKLLSKQAISTLVAPESSDNLGSSPQALMGMLMPEGKLTSRISRGKLLSTPLGAVVTAPSAARGATTVRLNQLPQALEYRADLLNRLDSLGAQGISDSTTRILVPERPLAPIAPISRYELVIPESDLPFYRKIFQGSIDTITSSQMLTIDMEHSDASAGAKNDIPEQYLKYISANLAQPYANDTAPLLVIVDDGFPSQKAFEETLNFFEESFPQIVAGRNLDRRWLSIKPPLDFPAREELIRPIKTSPPRKTPLCQVLDSDECTFHAKNIAVALRPLEELASPAQQRPVRVLWVPLFNSQDGAFLIAEKINRISFSDRRSTFSNGNTEDNNANEDNIRAYYKDLKTLYKNLPKSLPNKNEYFETPISYFEGITNYFKQYALVTGTPVIVSLSWRIPSIVANYTPPSSGEYRRLIVAAAGNPCNSAVGCKGYTQDEPAGIYDFLQRASNSDRNLLLVANVDEHGQATCKTALLNPKNEISIAFPGQIPGDCGTSYSAPRVAWLIAARERYNARSWNDNRLGYEWAVKLRTKLTSERAMTECSEPTDMRCIVLDLHRLFAGASSATRNLPAPTLNQSN